MKLSSQRNKKEKKNKKSEQSLEDLWDIIKCTNVHIIRLPEVEERETRTERFVEIMTQKIPNLSKDMDLQIQKALWSQSRTISKLPKLRHYVQILESHRQRESLERSKRKAIPHIQRVLNKILTGFLSRNFARQKWDDLFKVLKE